MQGMTKRERQITDEAQILKILDTAKVLHLGLCVNDEPYVVPMNYGFRLENGKLVLFDCETGDGKLLLTKNPAYIKQGEGAWRVSGAGGGSSNLTVTFDPLDISSFMEDGYLHMWVYVDGKLRIKEGQIELSSSGTCDVQEIYWNTGTYLREGWNELRLSLASATWKESSKFDPTCLNYLRVYFFTHVFTVFLSLLYALGQKVLYLSVY
jgi:hypothetical protein